MHLKPGTQCDIQSNSVKRLLAFAFALTTTIATAQETAPSPPTPLSLTIAGAIRMALSEGTQARLARTVRRARDRPPRGARCDAAAGDANLLRYNQSINLETFGFTLPGLPPIVGPFNVTDAQVTAAMQLFNLAALRAYQARTAGAEGEPL